MSRSDFELRFCEDRQRSRCAPFSFAASTLHVLGVNTVPYHRLTVRRLLSETYCYLVVTGRAAAIGHDTNMSSFEFWHRHQHSRVNVGLLSRKIWIPLATHQIGG